MAEKPEEFLEYCDWMGIPTASLYHYSGSVQGTFVCAVEETCQHLMSGWHAARGSRNPPRVDSAVRGRDEVVSRIRAQKKRLVKKSTILN